MSGLNRSDVETHEKRRRLTAVQIGNPSNLQRVSAIDHSGPGQIRQPNAGCNRHTYGIKDAAVCNRLSDPLEPRYSLQSTSPHGKSSCFEFSFTKCGGNDAKLGLQGRILKIGFAKSDQAPPIPHIAEKWRHFNDLSHIPGRRHFPGPRVPRHWAELRR